MPRKCHAELDSASNKIRDSETLKRVQGDKRGLFAKSSNVRASSSDMKAEPGERGFPSPGLCQLIEAIRFLDRLILWDGVCNSEPFLPLATLRQSERWE